MRTAVTGPGGGPRGAQPRAVAGGRVRHDGTVPRIIAGSRGSRRIEAPSGARTRPTSDRVREALFASVDALTELEGARLLDLYAGSGALALEGLSRGAAHATLVEKARDALGVCRRNAATLGFGEVCDIVAADVTSWLATAEPRPYDLVLADPPYARPVADDLTSLAERGWLAPTAVVVVERGARDADVDWPAALTPLRSRRYGDTVLHYARHLPHDGH